MCGICGAFGDVGRIDINAMARAMHHRGPDDSGVVHREGLALAMTRLAILDLSQAAHQPMANADGSVWIVYNGESYNFRAERDALRRSGATFRSESDTEVVLKMYERYGDDFVLRLRGMFALAVYDSRRGPGRERLLLARDHLGIKPLLYSEVGGTIIFASELKAMLASGAIERRVDPESLRLLLTQGSIAQPRTLVQGVQALLPAHRLIVESGVSRIERYWNLDTGRAAEVGRLPYSEQVRHLKSALVESVRLHLVSDVPLGAFLSGGVDSALLVALMAKEEGARIRTFSVGFGDEGRALDETDDALRVAQLLGTEHSRIVVFGSEVRQRITDVARALDQPSVDGINTYFVSLAARQAVTVAVSGTGGDELFAGYPWFASMARAAARERANRGATRLSRAAAELARGRWLDGPATGPFGGRIERLRGSAGFLPVYARQYRLLDPRRAANLLAPDVRRHANVGREPARDVAASDELPDGSPIQRVSALCLRGYTQNQLLRDIDAVSMAHSLEVRVPFLDRDLADLALSLPDSAKLQPGASEAAQATYRESGAKRILIDAGRDLLPADIDLQAKRGFTMPFAAWLNVELREILHETLSPSVVEARGLFNPQAVAQELEAFVQGRGSWTVPWLLMMVELWCREVLFAGANTPLFQGQER